MLHNSIKFVHILSYFLHLIPIRIRLTFDVNLMITGATSYAKDLQDHNLESCSSVSEKNEMRENKLKYRLS